MAGGRPKLWNNKEELQKSLEGFFEWCKDNEFIPDVEGLGVYLNCSRDTICEYEKNPEFTDTIKEVKNKIAFYKKQGALQGKINPTVFVFDFKNNHRYVDKTEVESNQNVTVNMGTVEKDGATLTFKIGTLLKDES